MRLALSIAILLAACVVSSLGSSNTTSTTITPTTSTTPTPNTTRSSTTTSSTSSTSTTQPPANTTSTSSTSTSHKPQTTQTTQTTSRPAQCKYFRYTSFGYSQEESLDVCLTGIMYQCAQNGTISQKQFTHTNCTGTSTISPLPSTYNVTFTQCTGIPCFHTVATYNASLTTNCSGSPTSITNSSVSSACQSKTRTGCDAKYQSTYLFASKSGCLGMNGSMFITKTPIGTCTSLFGTVEVTTQCSAPMLTPDTTNAASILVEKAYQKSDCSDPNPIEVEFITGGDPHQCTLPGTRLICTNAAFWSYSHGGSLSCNSTNYTLVDYTLQAPVQCQAQQPNMANQNSSIAYVSAQCLRAGNPPKFSFGNDTYAFANMYSDNKCTQVVGGMYVSINKLGCGNTFSAVNTYGKARCSASNEALLVDIYNSSSCQMSLNKTVMIANTTGCMMAPLILANSLKPTYIRLSACGYANGKVFDPATAPGIPAGSGAGDEKKKLSRVIIGVIVGCGVALLCLICGVGWMYHKGMGCFAKEDEHYSKLLREN